MNTQYYIVPLITSCQIQQKSIETPRVFNKAHGDVLVAGLGLGMIHQQLIENDDITSVTIVEKNQEVIDLVWEHCLKNEKFRLVHADIYEWQPDSTWDVGWFDSWIGECEQNFYFDFIEQKYGDFCKEIIFWKEEGSPMKREVLLLNSCEQILKIISWKKAVRFCFRGRRRNRTPHTKTHTIRTVTGEVEIPAAIVLVRFHELPELDVRPTRRNIFKRDNHTCQYCGLHTKNVKNLTIDHVHPRCKGGDNGWTNLVTACFECNNKKGNKNYSKNVI